jgi:hypothetical protein
MLKTNLNLDEFWDDLINCVVSYTSTQNNDSYHEVFSGSMPKDTLRRLSLILSGNGLQIGGFVGLTHCYLANFLRKNGTLCTIDPNLTHRGITNPFFIMSKLVKKYNLSKNSILICGYAEEQMRIFFSLGVNFDFILLDGNHDYQSVLNEINLADKLLKPGGLLILDDIDHWQGPQSLYNDFPFLYEKIPLDSRAGVLRKPVLQLKQSVL